MVTINAPTAGMMFFIIREVRSTPNASDAAIVFGFGEMILPALPPPIIARSIPLLDNPALLPMAIAIGATVITDISTKTPTAHIIIVAMDMAATALFCPSLFTMVSAIFSADPVLISAPARIPEVKIRRMDDIIPCAPETIVFTVSTNPPPPMIPPNNAPMIRLYAGCTFRMIKKMAIASPINAPIVENVYAILMPPSML